MFALVLVAIIFLLLGILFGALIERHFAFKASEEGRPWP